MPRPIIVNDSYAISHSSLQDIYNFTQEIKEACQKRLTKQCHIQIAKLLCYIIDCHTLHKQNPEFHEQLNIIYNNILTYTLRKGLISPTNDAIPDHELFQHTRTAHLPLFRLTMQVIQNIARMYELTNEESELNPHNRIILYPLENKVLCSVYGKIICNLMKILANDILIPKTPQELNIQSHHDIQNYDYHYDSSKRPDHITKKEWMQRYYDWLIALPTSNPKKHGMVVTLTDYDGTASELYFLQPEELLKYLPPKNERIQNLKDQLLNTHIKSEKAQYENYYHTELTNALREITLEDITKQTHQFIPTEMF